MHAEQCLYLISDGWICNTEFEKDLNNSSFVRLTGNLGKMKSLVTFNYEPWGVSIIYVF